MQKPSIHSSTLAAAELPTPTKPGSPFGGDIKLLKNLTVIKATPSRMYETASGRPVDFYNLFIDHVWLEVGQTYASNTYIAYESDGAVFTEFLYETGVLAGRLDDVSAEKTMRLYSSYLTQGINAKDPIVRAVALRTGRKPIKAISARRYISAANVQLKITTAILKEHAHIQGLISGQSSVDAEAAAFPVLAPRERSVQEMQQIHANTLQARKSLTNAGRTAGGGLKPPKVPKERMPKHVAEAHILPLLDNSPSPLHKLIRALGGAGGLRISEMCAVRLEDIDVGKRTLRVDDPSGYRAPENKYTNKEQFGFKGRETAAVTMFEPFQSIFWEALASYLEVRPRSNSPWLLLSTRPDTYGVPLCDLKGNTVTKAVDRSIQATQRKLKLVAPQGNYAIHSFRHFYGIWGRNYVCVPGRPSPGLGLEEMQLLMGHANAKTTEHYAPDLGLNRLAEIDAANMMVFHKGQGEGIDYYRGQVYARVADSLLKGDHDK